MVISNRRLDRLLPYGGDRPWNFMVQDGGSLRVDLHLHEKLPGTSELHNGSVTTGVRLSRGALSGEGAIGGRVVRCETVEWSLRCHTGYVLRDVDVRDMSLLCARFGLIPPDSGWLFDKKLLERLPV